jgi:hypothetical protein
VPAIERQEASRVQALGERDDARIGEIQVEIGELVTQCVYRPRGMKIGFLVCGCCAQRIFQAAEKNPGVQTPLHSVIEQNLTRAYRRHLASLDV